MNYVKEQTLDIQTLKLLLDSVAKGTWVTYEATTQVKKRKKKRYPSAGRGKKR